MNCSILKLMAVCVGMLLVASCTTTEPQKAMIHTTFQPGKIWQDHNGTHINCHGGGILDHDGTYYWFGQYMVKGNAGNKAQVGVSCYSSKDLYNWKNEGIALKVVNQKGHEIEKGCILERPKVIYNKKTDKYVMWFHLEFKSAGYLAARCAVAVADKVTGPYTYIQSFRPNAGHWPVNLSRQKQATYSKYIQGNEEIKLPKKDQWLVRDFLTGQMARDMTLYVDDDGKGYLICASEENSTLQIHELSDDFLRFTGKYTRNFVHRWMEAPALCKHNGRYWFIASGCSGWSPNAARSGVADSIMGPWRELANPTVGINPQLNLGPNKTFGAQSTYILPVRGKNNAFIAMFDIWTPRNAINGRHVWLPIEFNEQGMQIKWKNSWTLDSFAK